MVKIVHCRIFSCVKDYFDAVVKKSRLYRKSGRSSDVYLRRIYLTSDESVNRPSGGTDMSYYSIRTVV